MRKEVEEAQIGMRKASPYGILWINCTQYLRRSVRTSSSPWSRSDWWEAPRTATVRGRGDRCSRQKGDLGWLGYRGRTSAGAGAPKVGAQGPPRPPSPSRGPLEAPMTPRSLLQMFILLHLRYT